MFPYRIEGGEGKYFPYEKLISCVICLLMSSWLLGPLNKDVWFTYLKLSCGYSVLDTQHCRDGVCYLPIVEDPTSFEIGKICPWQPILPLWDSDGLQLLKLGKYAEVFYISCLLLPRELPPSWCRSATGLVCCIQNRLFSVGKTEVYSALFIKGAYLDELRLLHRLNS